MWRIRMLAAAGVLAHASAAESAPEAAEPAPDPVEPPPSDEELAEIEAAVAGDAQEAAADRPPAATGAGGVAGALQSLNPDIALILDVAGAWYSEGDRPEGG